MRRNLTVTNHLYNHIEVKGGAMKHTPTPWKQGVNYPERIIGEHEIVAFVNHPELDGKPNDREQANAEFIVRACNSHDELLEACKALVQNLEMEWLPNGYGQCDYPLSYRIIKNAKDIIAKAEGKE